MYSRFARKREHKIFLSKRRKNEYLFFKMIREKNIINIILNLKMFFLFFRSFIKFNKNRRIQKKPFVL